MGVVVQPRGQRGTAVAREASRDDGCGVEGVVSLSESERGMADIHANDVGEVVTVDVTDSHGDGTSKSNFTGIECTRAVAQEQRARPLVVTGKDVQPSIAVRVDDREVANSVDGGDAAGRESARAVREQKRDVGTTILGAHDIEPAIAIEIAERDDACHAETESHGRCKTADSVAMPDRHATREKIREHDIESTVTIDVADRHLGNDRSVFRRDRRAEAAASVPE